MDDEYIVDYSRTIFADEGLILGCFLDGTLRAIGELHQRANLPEPAAEAAITVERPYQSNGIGTEVMRRLIEFARDRSIKTLHMACLLENLSMQQIAINLGGVLTCIDGTVEADIIA